jgi:hypothetical protein
MSRFGAAGGFGTGFRVHSRGLNGEASVFRLFVGQQVSTAQKLEEKDRNNSILGMVIIPRINC